MTHYLIMTTMPKRATDYMIEDLRTHEFVYDKKFAKKHNLCTCKDFGGANLREVRLFEIDVPTPCTKNFEEEWLSSGFMTIDNRLNLQHKKPLLRFIFNILLKTFYKVMNTIVRLTVGVQLNYEITYTKKHGYVYRPFSPMSKRFAFELPKKYKFKPHFNERNFVLGKVIEHPIGSYDDDVKCPVCQKGTSQD